MISDPATTKASAQTDIIIALLNSLSDLKKGYITSNSKAYKQLMRVLYESRRRQLIQNASLWGEPKLARKLTSSKYDLI